ncbi:hypothetical protein MSAN_01347100 [Mycena sanguinolenta]|uniref:Uncharacterized protein n=1 Tax=Mycena sanguinolenta TaxID=230812 RepID=A0A8H7D3L4_9AGAR|nr:hypothetical protein MSAN_01347100 [Mycena sanguinolenta]
MASTADPPVMPMLPSFNNTLGALLHWVNAFDTRACVLALKHITSPIDSPPVQFPVEIFEYTIEEKMHITEDVYGMTRIFSDWRHHTPHTEPLDPYAGGPMYIAGDIKASPARSASLRSQQVSDLANTDVALVVCADRNVLVLVHAPRFPLAPISSLARRLAHSTSVRLPTTAPRPRLRLRPPAALRVRFFPASWQENYMDSQIGRPSHAYIAAAPINGSRTRTVSQPHHSSRESDACSDLARTAHLSPRLGTRSAGLLPRRTVSYPTIQKCLLHADNKGARGIAASSTALGPRRGAVRSWELKHSVHGTLPSCTPIGFFTLHRVHANLPPPAHLCPRDGRLCGANCCVAAHLMLYRIAGAVVCRRALYLRLPAASKLVEGPAVGDRRTRVARHGTLWACDSDALSKVISSRPVRVRVRANAAQAAPSSRIGECPAS